MEAVVHLTKCSPKTTLASARIANYLCDLHGIPLIDEKYLAQLYLEATSKLKRLYIVNSPMAFCDFREELFELLGEVGEVVWIQNDYNIDIPARIRGHITQIWSSVQMINLDKLPEAEHRYVNWNQLSTYRWPDKIVNNKGRLNGLFYFGAYREDRDSDFQKYLRTNLYPVHLSASSKAQIKFQEAGIENAAYLKPFDSPAQLCSADATVYMEDAFSHEVYCSPANRFYECLSAGVAIFFDVDTLTTMRKAGIVVPIGHIVYNANDVKKLLPHSRRIAKEQYQLWFKDYVADLTKTVKELRGK